MSSLISWILYQNTVLFYFINNGLSNPFFNFLMPAITNFGSFIAMGYYLCTHVHFWWRKY